MQAIKRFLNEEDGAVMIEYGLVAALVAVGCIVALNTLSTELNSIFGRIGTTLRNAAPTP